MAGCTTGVRVGRWVLALALAGILCVAASLVATAPAFAADTYTITIKADNNSVVDPGGLPLGAPVRTLTVDAGSSKTFMFYPHNQNGPQYRIKEVKVDNADVTSGLVASGGTYTLSDIRTDHTIEVTSESSTIDVEGFGFTDKIALDDTRTITPLPAGGTWWNSDPSVLSIQQIGTSGSYTFKGSKVGNAYAMYAVDPGDGKGPLIRRISIEVAHNAFDAGNLKYAVLKEDAPGKAGAPGENTVWVIGGADGQDLKSIVIPSKVSGNAGSPGTVYEVAGIKSSAFSDNATLESVDFSNCDVTKSFVGNDAFRTCSSLTQLVFGQKTAPEIVNGFYGAKATGTVYWPKGATGYQRGMFKPAVPGDEDQLKDWTFQSYPAPSVPQSFVAVPGDGQIELSWTVPAERMGIQKYQYSVTSDGSEDWKDIPDSDRSTTGFMVSGLANGTTYTFKVRAVNGAGEGDSAAVSAAAMKLTGITALEAVVGIAHGTPLSDIPLPARTTIFTTSGEWQVDIVWNRDSAKPTYDPALTSEQTFVVEGAVVLPDGVANPDNLSLTVAVDVTVKGKALLAATGDPVQPVLVFGFVVLAAGTAVAASRRLSRS